MTPNQKLQAAAQRVKAAGLDADEIFAEGTPYKQMLATLLKELSPNLKPAFFPRGTSCQAVYEWDAFNYDSEELAAKLTEIDLKKVLVDQNTVHFETGDGGVFVIFSIAVGAVVVGDN